MRTLCLMALSGCTFVGEGEFVEYRDALDQDGDGSPFAEDCDDLDPARSPITVEIPYDRVDQDCDDEDVIDADGDGAPGIERADWEVLEGSLSWPIDFGLIDCDDDPETGAAIFPGAQDVPYDGVDQDCGGENEYDLDGDGFTAVGYSVEEMGVWAEGLGTGDCNDFYALTYPGAPDAPADGHDNDCDGVNDYDRDGDGFTVVVDLADYQAFCALYPAACVPAVPTDPPDCDDTDPAVNPGASDPDLDCSDDSDGDGSIACAVSSPPCDCDDGDASVFPGAPETLDGIDEDCGADGDQAVWTVSSFAWEGATPPAVGAHSDRWIVGVSGTWNGLGAGVTDPATIFSFPGPYLLAAEIALSNGRDPGEAMDVVVSGSTAQVVGMSTQGANAVSDLREFDLPTGGSTSFVELGSIVDPVISVDAVVSGGVLSLLYCHGSDVTIRQRSAGTDVVTTLALAGESCVWDASGSEPLANLCTASGCQAYTAAGVAVTSRWPTLDVSSARHRDGVWVFSLAGGGVLLDDGSASYDLFGGLQVLSVDAASLGDGEVVVAAVVGGVDPHVELAWGAPAALTVLELAPDAGGRVPSSVGVDEADGVIGVFVNFVSSVAQDDQLAWVWLAL